MDSIVSQNGLVLGLLGDNNNNNMSPEDTYDVQSGWGLEGTHISGTYRILSAPYSPYTIQVDLTTMTVTSTGKYEEGMCIWEHR